MKGLVRGTLALLFASAPAWLQAESRNSSNTLTLSSGPLAYSAGAYTLANPTPIPLVDAGPECDNPQQPCHDFPLTISLPRGYADSHPDERVRISLSWSGEGASDYDLYVYKGDVIQTWGSEATAAESVSSNNPEVADLPLADGPHRYTVKVVPYAPGGEDLQVKIELVPTLPAGKPDPYALPALAGTVPAAPSLEGARSSQVVLKWQPPEESLGISAYRILRGTAEGQEHQYATVTGGKTAFADRRARPDVQYWYKVVAVNAQGSGQPSNEVTFPPAGISDQMPVSSGARPVRGWFELFP